MANTVRILITAKDEISGTLDKIKDKATALSKTDIGKGMLQGAGIAAFSAIQTGAMTALEAVGRFAAGSIEAASDQREAMSLTSQVFEKSTDSVKKWAANKKDAFSTTEALNFASQFGTAFKNVGMDLDDVTDKAERMTTLAGDLGSAFNTGSGEAATALKAGLLGESEPLRRFGVFLDETKTKAKALAMGFEPVNGAFTDGAKVAARYQLILEQTADSQGMFGRDQDSLADSTKKLESNISDLQAGIGEGLIPVLSDATQGALALMDAFDAGSDTKVEDRLGTLVDTFNTLNPLTWGMSNAFDAFHDAQDRAGEEAEAAAEQAAKSWDTGSERVGAALDTVTDGARSARTGFDRLDHKTRDLVDDFRDLDKWAENAGDALAEASYGPEELELAFKGVKLELRDNQDELDEARKKIKKLGDEGKPVPRELKKEFNRAEQAVNDSKQEVIRLGTKLRTTGQISMSDLRSQFHRLGININTNIGYARDLWYYLNLISDTDLGTGYDNQAKAGNNRAAGGPIAPYQAVTWQEHGGEGLMTASGGRVFPSTGGTGGGDSGGGGAVTINVNTPLMTPGSAQALAAAITPAIARELQRQQLIPRR